MNDFPVSDDGIRALRVQLLRELAAKGFPKEAIGPVAAKHKLTVDEVKLLVEKHGWPEPQAMRRHAFELEGRFPATPPPVQPAAPARKAVDPPPADLVEQLLAEAEKSTKARTRNLAKKLRLSLAELRGLVVDERKAAEAARADAESKARLRAEVERLERELAEKKQALTGRPAKTTTKSSGDGAKIRAWAAEHSVACPQFGRIPGDVREAYEVATRGAA